MNIESATNRIMGIKLYRLFVLYIAKENIIKGPWQRDRPTGSPIDLILLYQSGLDFFMYCRCI